MISISAIENKTPQTHLELLQKAVCTFYIISTITLSNTNTIDLRQFANQPQPNGIVSFQGNGSKQTGNVSFTFDGEKKPMSAEQIRNFRQIDDIAALKDNWNENGASSFPAHMISKAKELVLQLSIQPYVFPTANDSIQFEYEKDDGDYLEFELFGDYSLKMFRFTPDKVSTKRYISINDMDREVSRFYGRDI